MPTSISGQSGINTNSNINSQRVTGQQSIQVVENGRVVKLGAIERSFGDWVFRASGSSGWQPQNRARVMFYSTGADQFWTVPAGVQHIFAKLWGGGGAGGTDVGGAGAWNYASHGGGGGHTRGLIPVTPGETLAFIVGKGGVLNPNANNITYGFGGTMNSNNDNRYGGAGGGGTFIFRNYQPGQPPTGTPLLVAGGGGGGGSSRGFAGAGYYAYNDGGGGGGLTGSRGNSPFDNKPLAGGAPGTQASPGAGGQNYSNAAGEAGGYNGNPYQGGRPGVNSYGGGGGGGYRGGGGGAYSESNTMAGGGGGSGFIHSSVIFGETWATHGRGTPHAVDQDILEANNTIMPFGVSWGLGMGGIYRGTGFDGFMSIYY